MHYSVFNPLSGTPHGRSIPRVELVESIPGDGGAQAHQGQSIPRQVTKLGVTAVATVTVWGCRSSCKAQEISLNNPNSVP